MILKTDISSTCQFSKSINFLEAHYFIDKIKLALCPRAKNSNTQLTIM